jgi:tripartite ATP-independent transporter DctM subunit
MIEFIFALILWILLIIVGINIFISLGLISILSLIILGHPVQSIAQKLITPINSYSLLAVPMFILASEIMNEGGVTKKIINFSENFVGWIRGGLAQTNIMANLIITGISGSAVAEAAGVGKVLIPAMHKYGFSKVFSGCLTATASVLGPLIPPSIPIVIFATLSGASVGKLFLASFAPGVIVAAILSIYVYFYSKNKKIKKIKFSLRKLKNSFLKSFFAIIAPFIVLLGILSGYFSATESAAIFSLYCLFLSTFIYKEMNLEKLKNCFLTTSKVTSKILIILSVSGIFTYFVTLQGVSKYLLDLLVINNLSPTIFLILMGIIIIIMGCFLDGLAIMFLLTPILIPISNSLGIDIVHFGTTMIMGLMIGLITPPFGPSLFIVAEVGKISLTKLFYSIFPFVILLTISLLIIILFPNLVMILPNLYYK